MHTGLYSRCSFRAKAASNPTLRSAIPQEVGTYKGGLSNKWELRDNIRHKPVGSSVCRAPSLLATLAHRIVVMGREWMIELSHVIYLIRPNLPIYVLIDSQQCALLATKKGSCRGRVVGLPSQTNAFSIREAERHDLQKSLG